jgi:hypothetical protein
VWLGEVAVLAALGYAGVTRFLFPAAAALAVVGAAGVPPAPSSGGWIVAADVFLGITGPRLIDDDRHEVSYWIRLGRPV